MQSRLLPLLLSLSAILSILLIGEGAASACSCRHSAGWLQKSVKAAPRLVIARVGPWSRVGPDEVLPFRVLHVLKGQKGPRQVTFKRPAETRTSCDPGFDSGTIVLLEMSSAIDGTFGCSATGNLEAFLDDYYQELFSSLPRPPHPHTLSKNELRWVLGKTVGPFFSKAKEKLSYAGLRGASFPIEQSHVIVSSTKAGDHAKILSVARHGRLRLVQGEFDREGLSFSIAYLQKGGKRVLLAKVFSPSDITPARYSCSTKAECVVTCEHGALNKGWHDANQQSLKSCSGGCAPHRCSSGVLWTAMCRHPSRGELGCRMHGTACGMEGGENRGEASPRIKAGSEVTGHTLLPPVTLVSSSPISNGFE